MPDLTAVYLDFQDPGCYLAWQWLRQLEHGDRIEVRPFSLDTEDGEVRTPWDRTTPSWGLELLALGEVARERGSECHHKLVDAAFSAIHEQGLDLALPDAWLALADAAGIDLASFTADGDRWRAEVALWHAEAEDELGVHGVPTLVFDDEQTLYVRLDDPVADPPAAVRLLADLADLVRQPVEEVRRQA